MSGRGRTDGQLGGLVDEPSVSPRPETVEDTVPPGTLGVWDGIGNFHRTPLRGDLVEVVGVDLLEPSAPLGVTFARERLLEDAQDFVVIGLNSRVFTRIEANVACKSTHLRLGIESHGREWWRLRFPLVARIGCHLGILSSLGYCL